LHSDTGRPTTIIYTTYINLQLLMFHGTPLNEKETKNQVKNMLYAPLGILRFLRSANATLKS
jgi:hypothetical protein